MKDIVGFMDFSLQRRRDKREQGQGGIVVWQHPGWLYFVISLIRAVLFDFTLPIATGVYAVAVLLKTR